MRFLKSKTNNENALKSIKGYLAFVLFLIMITPLIPNSIAPYFRFAMTLYAAIHFSFLMLTWKQWWLKLSVGVIIGMLVPMAVMLIGRFIH